MSFFFFLQNGEQEDKTGPVWGLVPEGEGGYRKGCRKVNVVKILCTHV
jgi:hypothetical protein